jgi:hypothetical protein
MPHLRLALACLAAMSTASLAQDDAVCRENAYTGRPENPAKSELWRQQLASRDQGLMNQIAGQWYGEVTANIGGATMINRQYQTFDASGSYGYQDQTCSVDNPQMPCSTNQGYGRWAALPQQGGVFYIARNLSDLNRQDECAGFAAAFADPGHLVDPQTGRLILQRVR